MKAIHALAVLLLAAACAKNNQEHAPSGHETQPLVVMAHPAVKGGNTAAYFTYVNPLDEPDTLLSVSSLVADLVQVHESYQTDDGLMGMREIKQPVLSAGDSLLFEKSGLHIMLMNLNTSLAPGDSVKIVMNWAVRDSVSVTVPVEQGGADNHASHAVH